MMTNTSFQDLTMSKRDIAREKKRKRKSKIKPMSPSDKAIKEYRSYIRKIIRLMASDINDILIPLIVKNKSDYMSQPEDNQTGSFYDQEKGQWVSSLSDSKTPVLDGWASDTSEFFRAFRSRYSSPEFERQIRADVDRILKGASDHTKETFIRNISGAVGSDISPLVSDTTDIDELLISTVTENASLLLDLTSNYVKKTQNATVEAMKNKQTPRQITTALNAITASFSKRARLTARSEVYEFSDAVDSALSQKAGIKYYKWQTRGDDRVSGNPSGLYPKAKIKCFRIARADIGYGVGVFTYKDGAKYGGQVKLHPTTAHRGCRCKRIPMLEGVNFELPKK